MGILLEDGPFYTARSSRKPVGRESVTKIPLPFSPLEGFILSTSIEKFRCSSSDRMESDLSMHTLLRYARILLITSLALGAMAAGIPSSGRLVFQSYGSSEGL